VLHSGGNDMHPLLKIKGFYAILYKEMYCLWQGKEDE